MKSSFGTSLVRGFFLVSGLVIDLGFTPSADFEVWAPVRVAFDRTGAATRAAAAWRPWSPEPDWQREAGFAWHDVVHACNAAHRARPWQSLLYLQRIRNRTLSLASERHGHDADEFTHVDDLPRDERDPLLASLIDELDRNELLARSMWPPRHSSMSSDAAIASLRIGSLRHCWRSSRRRETRRRTRPADHRRSRGGVLRSRAPAVDRPRTDPSSRALRPKQPHRL